MPISLTYPGVYIEEIPSGVRTITGVSTSTTAFLGRAQIGPTNKPVTIHNFGDYQRLFGGLWHLSPMSYAVQQFFQNGGTDAVIVRLHKDAKKALITDPLPLQATSEGVWGNNLQVSIDTKKTKEPEGTELFNIIIEQTDPNIFTDTEKKKNKVIFKESVLNLSVDLTAKRYFGKVLSTESSLIEVIPGIPDDQLPKARPAETPADTIPPKLTGGDDGGVLTHAEYEGKKDSDGNKTGMWALDNTDIFNLLCIPPYTFTDGTGEGDVTEDTWDEAQVYCQEKRAFLIVDPPYSWKKPADAITGVDAYRKSHPDYSAIYFPRVWLPDPLLDNRLEDFVPCGVVAGIYARTDAQRGVWKAPAGIETGMSGVRELTVKLTDAENGDINPLGVNCLRNFPVYGNIVWGARTLAGADAMASEWKYIPIRRLALFIEESLFRGTKWVVFEPNDEPLWSQIRLNIGAFMHNLFRQGAFQGSSPRESYFVKCDAETTTQNDRNLGIVNILVGFAPLKPAEFVVIKIQQMAGEIET